LACTAVAGINFRLTDGDFQIDIHDGSILYNMSNSYAGGAYSDEVIRYMLGMSVSIVDEFNDKLMLLAKDFITLNDLLKKLNY